nr:MAG TPA: hypothetical protein [Caudoviricetes sp.]
MQLYRPLQRLPLHYQFLKMHFQIYYLHLVHFLLFLQCFYWLLCYLLQFYQ